MAEKKPIEIDFKKAEPAVTVDVGNDQDFINQRFLVAFALKKHVTVAPTYTPKNFFEQTVYYDDGTNRRRYDYINGTWRYVTLT